MSYYNGADWWDPNYKVRRRLFFSPLNFEPGSESHLGIQLPRSAFQGKVKSDFSDVAIFHNEEGVRPYYVMESEEKYTLIFKAENSILSDNADFYLYYLNESVASLEDDPFLLDRTNLPLSTYPTESNTRWLLTNPTIDWREGKSSQKGARAAFRFFGHRADLYFKTGPNYGKVAVSINGLEEEVIDCFSDTIGVTSLVSIDETSLSQHVVRMRVLDQSNIHSGSNEVEVVRADYHQVLKGGYSSEQYYSDLGFSILEGK